MSFKYDYDDEDVPIHGLRMPEDAFEELVNLVDRSYRYEWINGVVYDMEPSSPEHERIAYNIRRSLTTQIGNSSPCRVFQEQRVAIPGKPSVEPDIVVTCDLTDWNKELRAKKHYRFHSPLIIVEILSPDTAEFDRTEKFARYRLCQTLQVYILVDQDKQHVEVYRRENNWEPEIFASGQTILLDQLDLELPVDEIYMDIF